VILCLTGTNPYSFDRLVREVDNIARKHKVFIQTGNTNYIPENCDFLDFEENSKLYQRIETADLIITQGGFGSIMDALDLHKRIIAVPRKINFNESLDDQIELVKYFESKNYLLGCYNITELNKMVEDCLDGKIRFNKYTPESMIKVSDQIEKYIHILDSKN